MDLEFVGKRIEGVLTILPENEYIFEDEVLNPQDAKAKRLKRIIGFGKRRRVKGDTTLSDMFLYGMNYLVNNKMINKQEIGAIIVVTLSQDYLLPQISNIIHGEFEFSEEVICIDIAQACAGYVIGLIESYMLLEHMKDKKVLLCTGEIFNRKSMENEPKTEEPSFGGDVANLTIVSNSDSGEKIYGNVFNDGSERENLIIREGGFRYPMTVEQINAQTTNLPFVNVSMDGSGVFNFVQKKVPPAIQQLASRAGVAVEDIEYFLFHQPNKFMLQKLAVQLGVPYKKIPMDITERVGNSDSGTIPTVMTEDLSDELQNKAHLCCLSGFGGGLTWASLLMKLEKLDFCESIISNL